jgi:hypothetical protein
MNQAHFLTTDIGFATYLVYRGHDPSIRVESRNRSVFRFDLKPEDAAILDLEYRRSDVARFYSCFRHLREVTIRGARD